MTRVAIRESLAASFRDVMAGVCTPVSVVTAMDGDRPHGTTVGAFASLSLEPPMLLVSLDRTSDLLALLRETARFGVNVLSSDQAALATSFARKGTGKFEGISWHIDSGVPRLENVTGWVACDASQLVQGGDHVVALGTVVAADSMSVAPLTFHARGFGTHTPLGPLR